MDDKIKELKKIIDESNNIVFFGGAGVSGVFVAGSVSLTGGVLGVSVVHPANAAALLRSMAPTRSRESHLRCFI